ncbi:hypothetical protein, partial [Paramuribaculum intestinale]
VSTCATAYRMYIAKIAQNPCRRCWLCRAMMHSDTGLSRV